MQDKNNYFVVIRSSNERTAAICETIAKKESDTREVIVINESPFKKALEQCYRIAIEKEYKWLITIDADMILVPGSLTNLHQAAERMPESYFQLQGRIFDKITGDTRKAGPRIYRVELLPKALHISEQSADRIRPEAYIVMTMGASGYPSRYISTVTCFHDFEQYYSDLYRKSLVHAKKHHEFLLTIIKRAIEHQHQDTDFKVILKAVWDGLTNTEPVIIDSRMYKKSAALALKELKLTEKPDGLTADDIQNRMKEWFVNIPYNNGDDIYVTDQPKPQYSLLKRIRNNFEKRGGVKGMRYIIAEFLLKCGEKLKP